MPAAVLSSVGRAGCTRRARKSPCEPDVMPATSRGPGPPASSAPGDAARNRMPVSDHRCHHGGMREVEVDPIPLARLEALLTPERVERLRRHTVDAQRLL